MIEARALGKSYGDTVAVDGPHLHRRARRGHRLPGAERRRQVHHHADDPRARPPDVGQRAVNGKEFADHAAPLHEVGALLEARAVHTGRSARNHLLVMAATGGIGRTRVEEVIDLVGLADVAAGGWAASRSAWGSDWASPPPCSATRRR